MIDLNVEKMRKLRDEQNPFDATFWWRVVRFPDPCPRSDQEMREFLDSTNVEVIVGEYDVHGMLHRLSEIKVQPPYIFQLVCPKAQFDFRHRYVIVEAGQEYIWEKRGRISYCVYQRNDPRWLPPIHEDCAIYGRRHLLSGREEVMIVYPDNEAFFCPSVAAARAHMR